MIKMSHYPLANLFHWYEILPDLQESMVIARALAYDEDQPGIVCPTKELCFRALEAMSPLDVKVVILGQDPYHTIGKANGLAFGYHQDYQGSLDSSLLNIMTELGVSSSDDRFDRSLITWAHQGVLLLNTRLTVLEGKPLSHAYSGSGNPSSPGWEKPIHRILTALARNKDIVWLLWGNEAKRCAKLAGLDLSSPNVIMTSHPCRFSHDRGDQPFTGSRCFEKVNTWLIRQGQAPINWLGDDL